MVGGMSEFSELLTGVADTAVTLPTSGLDLTESDFRMTFLWTDYLFEKYGGLGTIGEIVSDTLDGFAGIDAALSRRGYSETHTQIFRDWVIAAFLDDPSPSFNGGLYGFDSLQVATTPIDVDLSSTPDHPAVTPYWSLQTFNIDSTGLGNTLLFNGGNTNVYALFMIKDASSPPGG